MRLTLKDLSKKIIQLLPLLIVMSAGVALVLVNDPQSVAIATVAIGFIGIGLLFGTLIGVMKGKEASSERMDMSQSRLLEEIEIRKARETELIEARQEALRGIQAKDQFLSNMSHEIRTPLNGIIGLINILKSSELNEKDTNYLNAMDISAKSLLSLINKILDLSKINSEKLTLEKINFNLHETVDSVEQMFQLTAKEKGIFLRTIISPKVPKMVCGDPVRLNQIILNLMSNAIKFTNEGGVDLMVDLAGMTDDGPRLSIQVTDTGVGIPSNRIHAIFEPFTQANDETSRLYGGSGLGLTISKQLVELMGGDIQIESKEGKGTCFSFEIQLNHAQKSTVNSPNQSLKQLTPIRNDNTRYKILVAEDNPINQMVVSTLLEKQNFDVTVVPNGQEVIETIYKDHYDLILMDVQMPVMSGIDATRFIRKATESPLCHTKIIAMTASVMKQDLDACMDAGMDDYVPKPFQPHELFSKIYSNISELRAVM